MFVETDLTKQLARVAVSIDFSHMASTKVSEHELTVRVDKHVVRHDLLVNDVAMVQSLDRLTQLVGDIQTLSETGLRVPLGPLTQRLTFYVLHEVIEVSSRA